MTENHNYETPSAGASDWHLPLNGNFHELDRDVPIWDADENKGNYAPLDGAHYIATDTGSVYEGDGAKWVSIGKIGNGGPELYSQASAPANPDTDDVWFDQQNGVLKYFDGEGWVSSGNESGGDGGDGVTSDVYIPMDDMSVSEAYDTSYGTRSSNYSIVSGDSSAGTHYMDATLHSGSHWGGNVFYYFPEHGHGQPDEVYSRIYIRLDPNWEMADSDTTCKLYWAGANMSAGDAGLGGRQPSGDDGFSTRVFCHGPASDGDVTFASYIYHMDQGGTYGDMIDWPTEVELGRWYQMDTYVKLNSVSNGSANWDGVYRAWLDGELQDEHTSLRWRTDETIGIDRLGAGTYWGGTEVSPRENHVHFDEHRISIGKEGL